MVPVLLYSHLPLLCFYFNGGQLVVSGSIKDDNMVLYKDLMCTDTPDASCIPPRLQLHRWADHIASFGLSFCLPPTPTFSRPACCQLVHFVRQLFTLHISALCSWSPDFHHSKVGLFSSATLLTERALNAHCSAAGK